MLNASETYDIGILNMTYNAENVLDSCKIIDSWIALRVHEKALQT